HSKPPVKNMMLEAFNKVLLENYSPTSLLLNERGEILYINGKTSKYLEINSGEANLDFHKMIREELKYAVGNAIYQAFNSRNKIEVNDIKIKEYNKIHQVCFTVEYLTEFPLNELLLLTFIDKGPIKKARNAKSKGSDLANDSAVAELEKELIYTKQQ